MKNNNIMTRFIKLSNMIINTSKIIRIDTKPNVYSMYMVNNYLNGFHILSFGSISGGEDTIHICEKENPADYKIVETWINQIKNE